MVEAWIDAQFAGTTAMLTRSLVGSSHSRPAGAALLSEKSQEQEQEQVCWSPTALPLDAVC